LKSRNIVIVFELTADPQMTQLTQLRDTVSFLISLADSSQSPSSSYHTNSSTTMNTTAEKDVSKSLNNTKTKTTTNELIINNIEIVLILESPGGVASSYGLAASQLKRLRQYSSSFSSKMTNMIDTDKEHTIQNNDTHKNNKPNLKLTICVDKVAASGGYMMACQASPNSLLAAPYAMIGSIGVVSQSLNFYSTLKNYGIQPITFKAPGEGKAPIGPLAKITKEGQEVVQALVDRTHEAFKDTVLEARGDAIGQQHIDDVATGGVFMGRQAKELGLVDKVMTSDEYIEERIRSGCLTFKLHRYDRGGRLGSLSSLLVPSRSSPFAMLQNTFGGMKHMFHECFGLML